MIPADQVFCRGYVRRKEEGLSKANFPNKRVAGHNALLIVLLKNLSVDLKESSLTGKDECLLSKHTTFDRKGNMIVDTARLSRDLEKERNRAKNLLAKIDLARKACKHEIKMAIAVERKGTGIIKDFEGEDDLDDEYERRLEYVADKRKKRQEAKAKEAKPQKQESEGGRSLDNGRERRSGGGRKKGNCFACGKFGHFSFQCRTKLEKRD